MVQLEAGAVDLVGYGLPVNDSVRLQADPAYQVLLNSQTGEFWCLHANCTVSPTNNKFVRQALNFALDRKRIADTICHGLAKPQALPWAPTSPAYDATKVGGLGFDPDKAGSLLAQSGASDIHADLVWSTSSQDQATAAQLYQADLAKIGLSVTLKPLEPAVYVAAQQKTTYQGLMFGSGLNGQLRPGTTILAPNYGPSSNIAGFRDDAYTELAKQVLVEADPARQRLLYDQMNDYFLDQSWVIPIVQNPPHVAVRAKVRGLRYDAHEALVSSDLWLA